MVSRDDLEFAEALVLEPNDLVELDIVELGMRAGGEYDDYPVITGNRIVLNGEQWDREERRALHAFDTVLRNELARLAPQVGTRIAALFKGKVPMKSGKGEYKLWRVKVVDGESRAFDWNREQQMAAEDPTPSDNGEPLKTAEPIRADEDVPF